MSGLSDATGIPSGLMRVTFAVCLRSGKDWRSVCAVTFAVTCNSARKTIRVCVTITSSKTGMIVVDPSRRTCGGSSPGRIIRPISCRVTTISVLCLLTVTSSSMVWVVRSILTRPVICRAFSICSASCTTEILSDVLPSDFNWSGGLGGPSAYAMMTARVRCGCPALPIPRQPVAVRWFRLARRRCATRRRPRAKSAEICLGICRFEQRPGVSGLCHITFTGLRLMIRSFWNHGIKLSNPCLFRFGP